MSDVELERLIDRAGRADVFAYARAAGWTLSNTPPQWVWVQIANEVLRRKQENHHGQGNT